LSAAIARGAKVVYLIRAYQDRFQSDRMAAHQTGNDLAFHLPFNIIISESCTRVVCRQYTVGFDELKKKVSHYTANGRNR
jgi:hypothetical protein